MLLEEALAAAPGAATLDIGTGTGILAIAALKLGAPTVLAIDVDPDAVSATQVNAGRNGCAGLIVRLAEPQEIPDRFPLVLANLLTHTHLALAPQYARLVAPGGSLVLGGMLQDEDGRVSRGPGRRRLHDPIAPGAGRLGLAAPRGAARVTRFLHLASGRGGRRPGGLRGRRRPSPGPRAAGGRRGRRAGGGPRGRAAVGASHRDRGPPRRGPDREPHAARDRVAARPDPGPGRSEGRQDGRHRPDGHRARRHARDPAADRADGGAARARALGLAPRPVAAHREGGGPAERARGRPGDRGASRRLVLGSRGRRDRAAGLPVGGGARRARPGVCRPAPARA